jgi:uncharacterized membrane protein
MVEIMPKCPKCGKDVSEDVNYCPNCGLELRIDIEAIKLKLEDLRHDEKMSLVFMPIGFVFIILGTWLEFGFTATRYEWIGNTLYKITYHPYADEGFGLFIVGAFLVFLSLAMMAYYSYKRSKLMERLPK